MNTYCNFFRGVLTVTLRYFIAKLDLYCSLMLSLNWVHYSILGRTALQLILDFIVLQDGSCNGLQHYAALGRDEVKCFCCYYNSLLPQTIFLLLLGDIQLCFPPSKGRKLLSITVITASFVIWLIYLLKFHDFMTSILLPWRTVFFSALVFL